MFGLSTESASGDGSLSPDDSAPGLVIDVHAIEEDDDDDNSVDDASSKLLSEYLATRRKPPVAPPMEDADTHHVFFVYHHNDRDWVMGVQERLQSPAFHFRCCSQEYGVDACAVRSPLKRDETRYAVKRAAKTAIVLSRQFISEAWWDAYEVPLLTADDVAGMAGDMLLILLHDCCVPTSLLDVPRVDPRMDDWWTVLLGHLCKTEKPRSSDLHTLNTAGERPTDTARCPSGINPRLRSGHLLLSLKSRCRCFGKETIDSTEVPAQLIAYGIQIPTRVYRDAIRHLMCESKFRYHILCYNGPAALFFFVALLGACILVTPVLEDRLGRRRKPTGQQPEDSGGGSIGGSLGTGMEFIHGVVVWLCALMLYMVVMHITKKKMKLNVYRRLTHVNSVLTKYNLLAGVENLGLADCNKYYLHFFYYDIGPCLATLQELMVESDERNCDSRPADVAVNVQFELDNFLTVTDTSRVLESSNLTNDAMRKRAEDLMLHHSGEYIGHVIKKKVVRPLYDRHVQDAPCLCQYVEHRVYKMIV